MAITFVAANNAAGTGVTNLSCNLPAGLQVADLLVIVYAFEGVAGGSGPWIIPNTGQNNDGVGPFNGWQQVCWQAPSGTGVGIEVWAAFFGSGTLINGYFAAAQNAVAVMGAWRGQYTAGTSHIAAAPPRLSATAQVTGNQPAAPSVDANTGDLVIAVGGDTMGVGQFGSPSGYTNRVDVARAGAGTVEATIADRVALVAGNTGPITFPNAASAAAAKGATATLVFSAVPAGAAAGPLFDAPLPADLDLASGWTLRVTALDPTTGAPVPGVNVTDFAMEVFDVNGVGPPGLEFGDFLLVPGPGA